MLIKIIELDTAVYDMYDVTPGIHVTSASAVCPNHEDLWHVTAL